MYTPWSFTNSAQSTLTFGMLLKGMQFRTTTYLNYIRKIYDKIKYILKNVFYIQVSYLFSKSWLTCWTYFRLINELGDTAARFACQYLPDSACGLAVLQPNRSPPPPSSWIYFKHCIKKGKHGNYLKRCCL